jgi:hypothetical protein
MKLSDVAPAMVPQQPSSLDALWEGIKHGAMNPIVGVRQLGARIPGVRQFTGTPQSVDAAAQARQQAYEGPFAPGPGQTLTPARAHPAAARLGEIFGEGMTTAPLAAIPGGAGMAGRIGMGALGGGLAGAMQPATGGKGYWEEKAMQAGVSAATGGALGAAGSLMAPALSPEARSLVSKGVRLTPGQRLGGTAQAAERALQAYPITNGYVQGLVGRSLDDFNRAAVRQALEPVNAIVPRSLKAGHALMTFATDTLSRAYDRVLPHLSLHLGGVTNAINNDPELNHLVSELPEDLFKQFEAIVRNRVVGRFDQATGMMDGQAFKQVESQLANRADAFNNTNQAQLGEVLRHLSDTLKGELAKQNPQWAPDLKRINAAYAMFVRLRAAATRRATSEGRFTPADLANAVRAGDTSAGRGNFAWGDALMQTLAEAGQKVIAGSFINRNDRWRWNDLVMGTLAAPVYGAARAGQSAPGRAVGSVLPRAAPAAGGEMAAEASDAVTPPTNERLLSRRITLRDVQGQGTQP